MKLKTNFSKESPVWLLGRCYHRKLDSPENTEMGTDVAAFNSQSNVSQGLPHIYVLLISECSNINPIIVLCVIIASYC